MADLILPMKAGYFDQIKAGTKPFEYRRTTPYWRKRIEGKAFEGIVLTRGYPRSNDQARRLRLPWLGYRIETITHPHFGDTPVEVFAIDVTGSAA